MDPQFNPRQVLQSDALELYFQPVIDLKSGLCTGLEGLTRWPSGGYTSSSPTWMLLQSADTALRQDYFMSCFEKAHNALSLIADKASLAVSINVDLADLTPELCQWIALRAPGPRARGGKIVLEICESASPDIPPSHHSLINDLKKVGIELAMDDYGSGASNDDRLQALQFDTVKIDKQFTQQHDHSPTVQFLQQKAAQWREQGKKVIMEGVETPEHIGFSRTINASHAQGYFFNKAQPLLVILDWVETWNAGRSKTEGNPLCFA